MKSLAIALSVGSVLAGLVGALYWYRASREGRKSEMWEMIRKPEKVEDVYWQLRIVHDNSVIAAKMNRIAALWTTVAVLLAGVASLAASISN